MTVLSIDLIAPGFGDHTLKEYFKKNKLNGCDGTFVLQHGAYGGVEILSYIFGYIIPHSGTDDPIELRGKAGLNRTPDGKHYLKYRRFLFKNILI